MNPTGNSPGKWLWPLGCALLCLGLGTASGLSTVGGSDTWYQELAKPPGTPPPWVFGPVWSVLYLLMGMALGRLVFLKAWTAVWVFAMQFTLNLIWTPVFFGVHRIDVALLVIAALWFGLVSTIQLARKSDIVAAWMLVPYWLWVSYAAYLNAGFFWLNGR
ncbi:MAG: TspO/MBR family protein [Luteolibacter sp.]|uniref:TspO/MBR family protein n=1 Tax=Luteolibacter sp. TaxID=1962973 RepID=UPI0032631F6F